MTAMRSYLDFEKPVAELEAKVEELKAMGAKNGAVSISEEVGRLATDGIDLAAVAEECPRGCTHLPDAPDCAIVEAVAEGRLGDRGAARLDSLQRLLATFA